MKWSEIRKTYPDKQWMVLEVLSSHTDGSKHVLDEVTVVETYPDSAAAFASYGRLKKQHPAREFLFMCTDRPDLAIEVHWVGGLRKQR